MQTGGELYDEGGYGCVFIPSLACKDKASDPTLISKLLPSRGAEEEFAIATRVRNIPFWKNFYVVPESMCTPAKEEKQTDKDIDMCTIIEGKSIGAFRLLRMKFGGTPLAQYRFNFYRDSFVDFSIHLIAAIANLTLHGIVHRDIHQGNILVDDVAIPRLIDFNLSIDVTQKIEPSALRHGYTLAIYQEPPDSVLVNAVALGLDPAAILQTIVQTKKGLSKLQSVLGYNVDTMQSDITDFFTRTNSVKKGDEVAWFKYYWRVIDSWAVGINLVYLLYNHMLWPSFVKSDDYLLYKKEFIGVLRDMCQISPQKRIDCVQALARVAPEHFLLKTDGAQRWLEKIHTMDI